MQHKEEAKHRILSLIKRSKKENIKQLVLEDRIDSIIEEIVKEAEQRIIARMKSKK